MNNKGVSNGEEKNLKKKKHSPPPPAPALGGLLLGASRSTSSVSRLSESGRITHRTCDPRSDRLSSACAGLPRGTSLTFFKCAFIALSMPTTVPWTTEPFLSSTWTVSCTSLERKLFFFFFSCVWFGGGAGRKKEREKREVGRRQGRGGRRRSIGRRAAAKGEKDASPKFI